jgi:protein-tyrosine phosphatase
MGFVDLHSHVLYGLDDGAPDEPTALALLEGLAQLGVTEQCLTPHQKASQYLPDWDRIEATFAKVSEIRRPHHPTLRLGAENMWDDVFYTRVVENTVPQ